MPSAPFCTVCTHVTVGVLQVEEELTLGQVAAGQSLRSGNRRRRCRRRVGVGEGQIRSRLVRRRGQLAAAVIGHVHRYVQHRIAVSDGAILVATSFTWYACEPVAVYEMALKVNALPTFVVRSISCPVATSISANVNSPSAGVRVVAGRHSQHLGARDLVGGLTRLVAVRKRHGIGVTLFSVPLASVSP